jgi:hypothetical protein
MIEEVKFSSVKETIIDKKKISRKIFYQIQLEYPFDKDLNFIGESILGYVLVRRKPHLIWLKNDLIKKMPLSGLIQTKLLKQEDTLWHIEWSYGDFKVEISKRNRHDKINEKQWERCLELKQKASDFLKKMEGNQIYIAI